LMETKAKAFLMRVFTMAIHHDQEPKLANLFKMKD